MGDKLVAALNDCADMRGVNCFGPPPADIKWCVLSKPLPMYIEVKDLTSSINDQEFYEKSKGVWLDNFKGGPWDLKTAEKVLDDGKQVCISPGADKELWSKLAETGLYNRGDLLLCTNRPKEAQEFFANEAAGTFFGPQRSKSSTSARRIAALRSGISSR